MAEKLRFHQIPRNGRHVDRYKRARTAGPKVMKGTRHQLLACPTLSSDQNRQVGADDTGHRLEDILHRARSADERASLLDTGLCLRRRP